ncbi:MAG: internalization competence protein, competence protein ComEC protein, partial [Candidatus Peregrinibacteria bacterium GW2011_GWF2_43_17]
GGIFVANNFTDFCDLRKWIFLIFALVFCFAFKFKSKILWLVCGILLGVSRFFISMPDFADVNFISYYNGSEEFYFEGEIVREIDTRVDSQYLTIEVVEPFYGLAYAKVDRYPGYNYGDFVSVHGELQEPFIFEDFSYKDYLARYGIYSVLYYPSISVIEEGRGSLFWETMFFLKGKFEAALNEIFPEPTASLASGLLLGSRKGMPDEILENFRISGLTHIVAISGYNITIVIAFVGAIFSFMPKRKQIIFACVFVVLFALFVGASAAVVRASIMGVIGLTAIWFGRQNVTLNAMILAATLMNLWNPKIILWDVGFQLSFMATLGIVYVSPTMKFFCENRLKFLFSIVPESLGIRDALILTLSAQTASLPIIFNSFGRISWVAPIANMLVAPLIPLAMLFSFGAAVLYLFGMKFLGLVVGYYAWFFMEAICWVAEVGAGGF